MKRKIQEQAKLSFRTSTQLPKINKQQQEQILSKQVVTLKPEMEVMIGKTGYFLASCHLIRGVKQICVRFVGGEKNGSSFFIKDEAKSMVFL